MDKYYLRLIENRVSDALKDTPVVLIAGPRQAGKTTLVKKMAAKGMRYITLYITEILKRLRLILLSKTHKA